MPKAKVLAKYGIGDEVTVRLVVADVLEDDPNSETDYHLTVVGLPVGYHGQYLQVPESYIEGRAAPIEPKAVGSVVYLRDLQTEPWVKYGDEHFTAWANVVAEDSLSWEELVEYADGKVTVVWEPTE